LGTDEGQALENDCPRGSQGKTMLSGKQHDHGRARGQSLTTIRFDPSMGEILDSPCTGYHGGTRDYQEL
jgi:hypothetical protein